MAETALRDGVCRQCVHHAQQMVEKLLKAMWVEERVEFPPPTHNLLRICAELGIEIDDQTGEFLRDLSAQYMPSRYGDVMVDYTREQAEYYYEAAVQICQRLLARLS